VAPLGLGFEAHTALVHADGDTVDLAGLVDEMAQRTDAAYVFGGVASSRGDSLQFAVGGNGNIQGQGGASGVFRGGLSGVAFGADVQLVSRVTQGCTPVSAVHTVTQSDHNLVLTLDGQPALDAMLEDLHITLDEPQHALGVVRATLVGLQRGAGRVGDGRTVRQTGNFGDDVVVRHIVGLDPSRRGVALADVVHSGDEMVFCRRNVQAARSDLVRICAEIREEIEPQDMGTSALSAARRMVGALYVSCTGRGGPHFGAPSAELQTIRHALGDVPLVGFFAAGEIARNHLYGYTGVLTVFTAATGDASGA
jgi:small ligand-binding sensory domain FIST